MNLVIWISIIKLYKYYNRISSYVDWYDISIPTFNVYWYKKLRGENKVEHLIKTLKMLKKDNRKVRTSIILTPYNLKFIAESISVLKSVDVDIIKVQSFLQSNGSPHDRGNQT